MIRHSTREPYICGFVRACHKIERGYGGFNDIRNAYMIRRSTREPWRSESPSLQVCHLLRRRLKTHRV